MMLTPATRNAQVSWRELVDAGTGYRTITSRTIPVRALNLPRALIISGRSRSRSPLKRCPESPSEAFLS